LSRRWCSPPPWRSIPTRAAPCSTAALARQTDASLSGELGTRTGGAHGHAAHRESPGTADPPPARTRAGRPSCIDRCSSGGRGRSGCTGRTSAGTPTGRTSRTAAHSPTTVRAALVDLAPGSALRRSQRELTHAFTRARSPRGPPSVRWTALCISTGAPAAAYSFPTGSSQLFQLPLGLPLNSSGPSPALVPPPRHLERLRRREVRPRDRRDRRRHLQESADRDDHSH
jgi:hypothetical protein